MPNPSLPDPLPHKQFQPSSHGATDRPLIKVNSFVDKNKVTSQREFVCTEFFCMDAAAGCLLGIASRSYRDQAIKAG